MRYICRGWDGDWSAIRDAVSNGTLDGFTPISGFIRYFDIINICGSVNEVVCAPVVLSAGGHSGIGRQDLWGCMDL